MTSNLAGFPTRWRPVQLKRVVDSARPITYGIVQAGEDVSDGVPYIRPVDMSDEGGVSPGKLRRTSREIAATYRRSEVSAGDLVVSIGPSYGKVMVVPADLTGANLTQGTARVSADDDLVYSRYLFWCLRSTPIVRQWDYSVGGATFRALNLAPLAATLVPTPPLDAQRTIADFLDRKTAAIDDLIARKERLIELLQEKRQALITQAVTKGLDPSVPMKESGVEWIGSVPRHWDVVELRRKWDVVDCKHVTPTYVPEGVPLVSTGEVKPGPLDLSRATRFVDDRWHSIMIEGGRRPMRGDLIYSRNASLGAAALVAHDDAFVMGQDVVLIRSERQSGFFLAAYLNSVAGATQVELASIGSTFKRINVSQIRELLIVVPPEEEQERIADVLSSLTDDVDSARVAVERSVDLLREYRQALISNAVTGQLDLPGAA
ncbi:MAG: restriction endonuclease subunit S [Polyangiaceae bacterium]|nr:restriction endonuclease subunit S [Polyangiaceae bacterium]